MRFPNLVKRIINEIFMIQYFFLVFNAFRYDIVNSVLLNLSFVEIFILKSVLSLDRNLISFHVFSIVTIITAMIFRANSDKFRD